MKKGIRIAFLILMGIVLLFIFDFICIWIFNKPFFAIKKDNNDSVNLVYSGLLYDTYICHEHSVPQIKIKGTKFTCAYIGVKEMNESVYIPTEVKNVSMSISSLSLTGATIIIKDTNKNPYTYGEWYMIERKVNGKWYEVLPIIENYGFNSIGYLPNENNEVKFIIDWEWLYGKLSYGSYRILKEVGSYYISLEFEISEAVDKKIEVIKPEFRNDIKFNDYLVLDNRTIYLAGNIEEIYYIESGKKITLKDYITKSFQTTDDAINNLVNMMVLLTDLNDGGTEIYNSYENDVTLVKCNTVFGNKDIYIGDYLMKFDNYSMCK